MSKYIAISDARALLPDLVEKVNSSYEEVIITVYGKPLAKLVSAEPDKKNKQADFERAIGKHFGVLPDFPDVTKDRRSRKEKKENLLKWAGVWNNKDGELIAKYAAQMRMKGKILRSK